MQEEYLEIGQIVNTSGLNGLLKINPFTDDIKRFEKLKTIYICNNKEMKEFEIEKVGYIKKQVLLKFKNIDSIEQAEKYKESYIKIKRDDSIKLAKDTYFIIDLIGVDVYTTKKELIGKISDIFSTGSNDVYVVENESSKQILLPAISEVIKNVDIENKKMIVEIIEGLL